MTSLKGAHVVVKAMEDTGVRFTFGIPGTHNIELYDALEDSEQIQPILVTDEQSASFMADAVSRSSNHIGVANLVPGAGVTHALSGIAEAFMDNISLLVLLCGIRTDTGKAYQLHDIDQLGILRPITKKVIKVRKFEEIYPAIQEAIFLARKDTPGPVAVEIPVDLYLFTRKGELPERPSAPVPLPEAEKQQLDGAAALLNEAKHPAIYAGYGCRNACESLIKVAEALSAPVATSIQGKGVFPENHPLWVWNGFGASAPGFVRKIMNRCDGLLAIGCRFGEVATASYGLNPPDNLIHVDINEEVFNKNYKARLAVKADAERFLQALLPLLKQRSSSSLQQEIEVGHSGVRAAFQAQKSGNRVSPCRFFSRLQQHAGPESIYVTDSGNGTFLAMEHLRLNQPGCFLAPVDFSCMGYSVPGAIGAKLANPEKDVIALTGDGALLMTGLELITAASYNAAPVVFVLRDNELGEIAQFQRTSMNRDTCSILGDYSVKDLARTTKCEYLRIEGNQDLEKQVPLALETARSMKPVLVEVAIDYSNKTYFTKGVVTTNFWRFPWMERLHMIKRVVNRKIASVRQG